MRRRAWPAALMIVAAVVSVAACSAPVSSTTPSPSGVATSSSAPPSDAPSAPPISTPISTPSGSPNASGEAAPGQVYAQAGAGMLSGPAGTAKPLVYVPATNAAVVDVIDPTTFTVVRTLPAGKVPQHVVPSWDLKTLWVNNNVGDTLTPIDPATGTAGTPVSVVDPYNLYFTPDGAHALVMAERQQKIYYRDPHTMAVQHVLDVPCRGVNHADFTADGSMFVASCEFSGRLIVVPTDGSRVTKVIDLNAVKTPGGTDPGVGVPVGGGVTDSLEKGVTSMPQDVRLTPDGRTFLAADMLRNGVWLIDAATFTIRSFLPTGDGAHGVYPSRDGASIYVANRGDGSISVLDAATLHVRARWTIPGGGSPDMGGVNADGTQLWLSGRYHNVVYVFDTRTGALTHKIPVHAGPHGLCVWPQPGRYSLGHTGNMR